MSLAQQIESFDQLHRSVSDAFNAPAGSPWPSGQGDHIRRLITNAQHRLADAEEMFCKEVEAAKALLQTAQREITHPERAARR